MAATLITLLLVKTVYAFSKLILRFKFTNVQRRILEVAERILR